MEKIVKKEFFLFTYRYFWKTTDSEKVNVQYITDSVQNHEEFLNKLIRDDTVVSALREYVSEIDCQFLGFTETIKSVKNEENKDL